VLRSSLAAFEGGVATYRVVQGANALAEGNDFAALGYFGEATLRLVGASAEVLSLAKQARRAQATKLARAAELADLAEGADLAKGASRKVRDLGGNIARKQSTLVTKTTPFIALLRDAAEETPAVRRALELIDNPDEIPVIIEAGLTAHGIVARHKRTDIPLKVLLDASLGEYGKAEILVHEAAHLVADDLFGRTTKGKFFSEIYAQAEQLRFFRENHWSLRTPAAALEEAIEEGRDPITMILNEYPAFISIADDIDIEKARKIFYAVLTGAPLPR